MSDRQPKTFDNLKPGKEITDPERPEGAPPFDEYPRHMHAADGSYLVVTTDEEKAAALDEGYTLEPTHEMWTDHGKKPKPVVTAPKLKAKK